jgi:hypothetical protein
MGEAERCSNHVSGSACLAQVDGCSEGSCSGVSNDGKACGERTSDGECTGGNSGCTWAPQCCQWIAKPTDLQDTCLNKGKGTLAGVCTYSDGEGPPSKEIIGLGFEHRLFSKGPKFNGHCAMVASFRIGKGAAVVLGSDKPDIVGTACKGVASWRAVAEHIGHTSDSIDEYCANFIPETSAMSSLTQYSPAFIITKAKQGQFEAVFPGFKDFLFIVTAKPEFGECLFTAEQGKFGAGVCTCDKEECNNKTALELIVDGDKGPMRLLQFIDGSLSNLTDEVNSIVTGLLDAEGKINRANVGNVTEANVEAIMKLDGLSMKTSKAELWGIVQDFQKQTNAEADYKKTFADDETFTKIKVDAANVVEANAAAGCQLYGDDGITNTFCLQNLSADKLKAVSDATGFASEDLAVAKKKANNLENGDDLNKGVINGDGDGDGDGSSTNTPPQDAVASRSAEIVFLSMSAVATLYASLLNV